MRGRLVTLGLVFVALPTGCATGFGSSGGCDDCACPPGYVKSGGACLPSGYGIAGLGSDWHPDPDGDGVASAQDRCPYVYDPDQSGDACDPDHAPPSEGGTVTDLHAEHVTPYGGWFSFRSPATTQFGWQGSLIWSPDRDQVAFGNYQGKIDFRIRAPFGQEIELPLVVTEMNPGTDYYLAVVATSGELEAGVSNVLRIHTEPEPMGNLSASHPRVVPVAGLAARAASDASFALWEAKVGPAALSASTSDIEEMKYAVAAAILFHATGEARYRDQALSLYDGLVGYYEGNPLEGNAYRWADAALGLTLDLLWDELDSGRRSRGAAAMLEADRAAIQADVRLEDSDQLFADTRTLMVDGLVACQTPNDPGDACTILDAAKRRFFGIESVMMRRDKLTFAQSGGHMPDSTDYGQGTAKYWLETLDAMATAGVPAGDHAGWVLNNFLATAFHSVTPRGGGLVSYGDVQQFQSNDEANSVPISGLDGDLAALQMGLLDRAGLTAEARFAKHALRNLYPDDDYAGQYHMLLADHDGISAADGRGSLPVAYWDSGMGIFYDRTSWGADASLLAFRSGWQGADHMHEDVGHFQLYRRGRWVTHEAIGYLGTTALAEAHNVPLLDVDYEGERRAGQFATRGSGPSRVLRLGSGPTHAYAVADLTPAYRSHYYLDYAYGAVQRSLVWLKADELGGADVVVLYDLVVNGPDGGGRARRFALHFDVAPQVSGERATIALPGSPSLEIEVAALLPAGSRLSARAPEGPPDEYPGQIYTHRLIVEPGSSGSELRSLITLAARDAGSAAPVDAVGVDESGVVGARVGGAVVLFTTGGEEAQVAVDGDLPLRVYWAGLSPRGLYSLTASGSGPVTLQLSSGGSLEADDSGLLAVELSASGSTTPLY